MHTELVTGNLRQSRRRSCRYLHAVVEEFPHGSDTAVGPLVLGQPRPGVFNVPGMHEDVRPRPAERLHHEGGQPGRSRTENTRGFFRKQVEARVSMLVTPN